MDRDLVHAERPWNIDEHLLCFLERMRSGALTEQSCASKTANRMNADRERPKFLHKIDACKATTTEFLKREPGKRQARVQKQVLQAWECAGQKDHVNVMIKTEAQSSFQE